MRLGAGALVRWDHQVANGRILDPALGVPGEPSLAAQLKGAPTSSAEVDVEEADHLAVWNARRVAPEVGGDLARVTVAFTDQAALAEHGEVDHLFEAQAGQSSRAAGRVGEDQDRVEALENTSGGDVFHHDSIFAIGVIERRLLRQVETAAVEAHRVQFGALESLLETHVAQVAVQVVELLTVSARHEDRALGEVEATITDDFAKDAAVT